MNALIVIGVDENGGILVQNGQPIVAALGLLEIAKDILKDTAKQAAAAPQLLVATGYLPPSLKV